MNFDVESIKYSKIRPILVIPAVPNEKGILFIAPDKKILVKNNIGEIWNLLKKCDGHKLLTEICSNEFEISLGVELLKKKILSDSCSQYEHFHELSANLQMYPSIVSYNTICEKRASRETSDKKGIDFVIKPNVSSELFKLQKIRKSCRSFDTNSLLSLQELGGVCDCAYSRERHATPSGGKLYPLSIYCIVQYEQKGLKKGFYEYDSVNCKLILYKEEIDREQLVYCFNDETNAFNSPVQIIICADFDIQGEKYSNLGYRLTLIETGHVAQNIVLYCAEQGMSSCELGGFLDKQLSKEMELRDKIKPVLAIAIGKESSNTLYNYPCMLEKVQDRYVGEDKIVKAVGIHQLGDKASIFGAWAKFGDFRKNIAGATGKSIHSALCKAIIESYERYRSSIEKVDYRGKVHENAESVTLEQIAPMDENVRKKIGLDIINEKIDEIDWTQDMTGKTYLPTDYIFYGNKKKNKVIYGNSSGVAAYTDYDTAKKKAVAELIERDAIMRCWYGRLSPFHLSEKSIPQHVLRKQKMWQEEGRNVHILFLESYNLPTFLCVIESTSYPFFVSGSATAIDGIQNAIEKSFYEAEYNLLLSNKYPCKKCPDKTEVFTPMDHGQYYHFEKNSKKIHWLWENDETTVIKEADEIDFELLYKRLNVLFVDLTDQDDDFIKVVRAVSTKLIPIGFGYERDYVLHPAAREFALNNNKEPHFFA